jgi:hypothetical protein
LDGEQLRNQDYPIAGDYTLEFTPAEEYFTQPQSFELQAQEVQSEYA